MGKKNIIFTILISLVLSILFTCLIRHNNAPALNNQDDSTTKSICTNAPTINTVKGQDIKVVSSTPSTEDVQKEEDTIMPTDTTEPFVGSMDLDSETEKIFYGTWKVEKLLGFANSYNDASEYPTGQKIIDDEIIINKDFFSSKGLTNYEDYQYEIKNPLYNILAICYNKDSFYRLFKTDLTDLQINDEVKYIGVSHSTTGLGIPVSFIVVNNDRLILALEATDFELKRVTDMLPPRSISLS